MPSSCRTRLRRALIVRFFGRDIPRYPTPHGPPWRTEGCGFAEVPVQRTATFTGLPGPQSSQVWPLVGGSLTARASVNVAIPPLSAYSELDIGVIPARTYYSASSRDIAIHEITLSCYRTIGILRARANIIGRNIPCKLTACIRSSINRVVGKRTDTQRTTYGQHRRRRRHINSVRSRRLNVDRLYGWHIGSRRGGRRDRSRRGDRRRERGDCRLSGSRSRPPS